MELVNDIKTSTEVKVNSNLVLNPWQRVVVDTLATHKKGYVHVIKSKRQVGKSVMLELILMQTAINKRGSTSIFLSPTLEQARKVFREVKSVLQPTKLYERHNDLQLIIMLKNHSWIYFKSAEQRDGLRGFTVNGVYCVDEAAYISDDIFYDTLAWVNVSLAPVIICSTPRHKTGFFYKYYTMGLSNDNPNIFSYNWSEYDTSALLPDDKLEEYRRQLPAAKFKTEFLGEFLDNEGGVFGEFSDLINNNPNTGGNCYMGIDWAAGVGGDETAIVIVNDDREMLAVHHFNDKDEAQTINYIIDLMREYKPLKCEVEMNSIGTVFCSLLQKAIIAAGLPVMLVKFTTTNESKERLVNQTQVWIQNKQMSILDNQSLLLEMDVYECKVNQNGKRLYNATPPYHDDLVMGMMLALDCVKKGTYSVL